MRSFVLFFLLVTATTLTGQRLHLEQSVPGHYLSLNNIRWVHAHRPELDGRGSTVSIKEFAFDSSDIDVKGRVLPFSNPLANQNIHATLMASLVGGAGNSAPAGRGVARGAMLYSSGFVGLRPDTNYATTGVVVQNHSYGTEVENYYGAQAVAYDQTTVDYPYLLHVFSAGNKGVLSAPDGSYAGLAGWSNLTGNAKMAKNILVVGATDSLGQPVAYSSRGPAYDGRIKPDLVAFGAEGTSGAAALVSGAAAVIRQAFYTSRGYYPSAQLLRCILLGAANDIGVPGPDFVTGFGALDLKRAVELAENAPLYDGFVEKDSVQTIIWANVPPALHQFKITLHWNDIPAASGSAKSLVNDLDLEIVDPAGISRKPWIRSVVPLPDSLSAPGYRGVDTLNNTEQITIEVPLPGDYFIKVKGQKITTAAQAFSVAILAEKDRFFEWVSPVKGETTPGNEALLVHWATNIPTSEMTLYWRNTRGEDWHLLTNQLLPGQTTFRWTPPDSVAAVQLRCQTVQFQFDSDTFLLVPPLPVRTGLSCPDSFLVYWPSAGTAVQYRLWGLGAQYLEPLLLTADTVMVLSKSQYPARFYAVAPVVDGVEGTTGSATNIQSGSCYINSLVAFPADGNQIAVVLQMGSVYRLKTIVIEKWNRSAWVPLVIWDQPGAFTYEAVDNAPLSGLNQYRATLTTESGEQITSETSQVYFAPARTTLLLPNPAQSGAALQLVTSADTFPLRLVFLDMTGKWVAEQKINFSDNSLAALRLPPGIYFWTLTDASSRPVNTGKLVVVE